LAGGAQLSFNAALACNVAIIPDRIPRRSGGQSLEYSVCACRLGRITGTFLVQQLAINMTLALVIPGIIGVVGVLGLAFVLRREPIAVVLLGATRCS